MSRNRPVFFFAFANDPHRPLRLGEEENACAKALASLHDDEKIEYHATGHATLENIYDSLDRFNDRLYLFHFGGHSDGQGLRLADTAGRAESLAVILGRQKNLKLVFLNGCANDEQVEVLWDKGVRVVIATSADVDDQRALALADRFYRALAGGQSISEAFDTAKSFVKNDSEITIDYIYRGIKLPGSSPGTFSWGLYVQDNTVLDWRIGKEDNRPTAGNRPTADPNAAQAVNRLLLKERVRQDRSLAFWRRWFYLPGKDREQEHALKALNLFEANEIWDFQQALRRYLPLYYRDNRNRKTNFLDALFEELNDERSGRRFYLLLGETGIGKTTALLNLFIRYASAKRRYAIVFAQARHLYAVSRLTNKEQTILLLDGIDEAPEAFQNAEAFFTYIEDIAKAFTKVVISCRTQFFVSRADERQKTNTQPANEYTHIHLELLDIEAVRGEISRQFSIGKEQYRTALSIVNQSGNLFRRPLLLSHIESMVENKDRFLFLDPRMENLAATITPYEIYRIVIGKWIEREEELQKTHFDGDYGQALRECTLRLAQHLYERETNEGKRFLFYADLKRLATAYHLPVDDLRLRDRSLLHRNEEGYYRFAHRTFKEYFYAHLLYEGILPEETFPFDLYEDAARFYRDMCEVKYYQDLPAGDRRGHQPGRLAAAVATYPIPCLAVQTFCALRGLHASDNVFELFTLLVADSLKRYGKYFVDLAEWIVTEDQDGIPEEHVIGICDSYKEKVHLSDLLAFFFFRKDRHGYAFLHRSFAELFCLYDLITETDEESAREAMREFPFEKLRFSRLFANEINWLRLRQHQEKLHILMDSHDVSVDDYRNSQAGNTNLLWSEYMHEKSRVKWSNYPDYYRRLRQTQRVRLHFPELGDPGWFTQLPFPGEIKHLDISHNGIEGPVDLSRFIQLESLDISGNPSLELTNSQLPGSLEHLIQSGEASGSQPGLALKGKLPHIITSRNGNPVFALPREPFREPEMVEVKGGAFWMGSEDNDTETWDHERPLHLVQLSNYSIGKYPVTVEEFAWFVRETGYVTIAEREGWVVCSQWRENPLTRQNTLSDYVKTGLNWRYDVYGKPMDNSFARYPVVYVSWHDATAYADWLSRKTGKAYSLPTEAQWEYAAIGGHRAPRKDESGACRRTYTYAGSDDLSEVGWYFENVGTGHSHSPRPVGTLSPNELGLYDMSGNVWEWCRDWFDAQYYQECQAQGVSENPTGAEEGLGRVLRGGSWDGDAANCRTANRNANDPANRNANNGFRLVFVPQLKGMAGWLPLNRLAS